MRGHTPRTDSVQQAEQLALVLGSEGVTLANTGNGIEQQLLG